VHVKVSAHILVSVFICAHVCLCVQAREYLQGDPLSDGLSLIKRGYKSPVRATNTFVSSSYQGGRS